MHPTEVTAAVQGGELAGDALVQALRLLPNPAGIDLKGATLHGADLSGMMLFGAKLDDASLDGADLSGAELSGASLVGASLHRAKLADAGLGRADLSEVNAFEADFSRATLTGATLTGGTFHLAGFEGSRILEATLDRGDFRGADFRGAELTRSTVFGAGFDEADLRGASLRSLQGYESASWYATDIRDINFAGAYRLRRHVMDENYLKEFRASGPMHEAVYRVWWFTSDCGRSMGRWLLNIGALVVLFAALFALVGVDLGGHAATPMTWLYYSVVTLTSLGYGDILPTSGWGQLLVVLEVSIGYMMLGGLISILANKMSRRAE